MKHKKKEHTKGQLEKYLEAKAERYQTLAQEGNSDLELHAKKFKNERKAG
jgi:hypothetical protein